MAKKKKKVTPEEAVRFTIHALYDSVFRELTPDEVMERLTQHGYHHHFMEFLYPATEKMKDMEYGRALDEFESDLASWVAEAGASRPS